MYKSIILCKKIQVTFSIYLIKQFTKLLVGKTKNRQNVVNEVLQVLRLSPAWIKPDTSTSPSIMVTSYHLNT